MDARAKALEILNALDHHPGTLDLLLESYVDNPAEADMSPKDRGLTRMIVFGVLRHRVRLDWIISRFSSTKIKRMDLPVLNILRIALFQVIYLDRIPTAAAVHTAVETAKSLKKPWLVKFVNAVLRKAVKNYQTVSFPDFTKDPVNALSVTRSFPQWLIRRWLERFSAEETRLLCDACNTPAALTLRVNTLFQDPDALARLLEHSGEKIEYTRYAPCSIQILHPKQPVHALPSYEQGGFQVQDGAAQMVALLLDPRPGERVFDACAGLGGKTGYIAQLMENKGELVAADKNFGKLEKLSHEMTRLGILIVKTIAHDLIAHAPDRADMIKKTGTLDPILFDPVLFDPVLFDRVLVDAPCTGLGVIRRNPDTKWAVSENDPGRLGQRQRRFLDHAAPFVRPGGVLVYAVCSTEPEEGEDVSGAFLETHPEFSVEIPDVNYFRELTDDRGYVRTWPHCHDMDGFFAVRFKRKGDA